MGFWTVGFWTVGFCPGFVMYVTCVMQCVKHLISHYQITHVMLYVTHVMAHVTYVMLHVRCVIL